MAVSIVRSPLTVAPEIVTPRLRLRSHRCDDFDAMQAIWGDEQAMRFILGRASTPQETWARLLRYAGHWQIMGFGYWAIEDLATGTYLGELGFADFRRAIEPPLGAVPEAGWIVSPEHQGRGIATEALAGALTWADESFTVDRTVCILDPEHEASRRLAERCGYRQSHVATFMDQPTMVMQRKA